ncbi:hypothetical protein OMAG_001705, partial [Candidatus Omnitrophus magneticus]
MNTQEKNSSRFNNNLERAIYNICRIAKVIIVTEHNGLNPGMRLLEEISRYH